MRRTLIVVLAGLFTFGIATELSAKRKFRLFRKKKAESEATGSNRGSTTYEVRRALPANEHGARDISSANDTARFLAGLSSHSNSSLNGLRRGALWRSHARSMDQRWRRAEARLGSIRSWRRGALGGIGAARNNIYYPFSGPDILYAHTFFPSARNYFLCGLEPVGSIPDLNTLSASELATALSGLQTSVATALDYSYFITKDMRRDLASTPLKGALPVLYTFLARTNHRIQSVERVSLTSGGKIVNSARGNGVRIRCSSPGGSRTVYYFSYNLSNGGGGGFDKLMRSQGAGVTFIKSASYLLHSGGFSRVRNTILNASSAVLQDPSGVPFSFYDASHWDVALYGNYVRTLDMFRQYYQPDLAKAFQTHGGRRLGFGVGYVFNVGESSLLLAKRR